MISFEKSKFELRYENFLVISFFYFKEHPIQIGMGWDEMKEIVGF